MVFFQFCELNYIIIIMLKITYFKFDLIYTSRSVHTMCIKVNKKKLQKSLETDVMNFYKNLYAYV